VVVRRVATIVTGAAVLAALGAGLPAAAQAAKTPGWRIAATISTSNTSVSDVVATSATSAWATGVSGTQTPVVYRWRAGHWRTIARPGPTDSFASAVAATSAANAWVMLANDPVVDHWNGHRWVRKSFAAKQQILMSGLTTTGPDNAWVFTENFATRQETAHHYNGKTWTARPLSISVDAGSGADVSSSSASDIWAWGYDIATSTAATLHYNGHAWRVVPLPAHLVPSGVSVQPQQVLAESASNVWATVSAYSSTSAGPVVLLHWNGHLWRKVTGKLPPGTLTGAIASDGHGGLWLGGASGTSPYLAHYRAGKWTRQPVPAAKKGAVDLSALTLIPGTRSLWGAGPVGLGFGTTAGAAFLKYGS
jgi:hypothetical protein